MRGFTLPAQYSAEEIIEIVEGRMAQGMVPDEAGVLATDTRASMEGAWFVALVGKNFDGHDFIGDAFCNGALGCIVEDRGSYPIASTSFPLIAVDDTELALAALVRNWRKRMRKKVVLVTSSLPHEQAPFARDLNKYLVESGEAQTSEEEGTPSQFYVDWRINASEILNAFLNLPDDLSHVVADFAPRPLTKAPWLVEVLKPDLLVITGDAYEFDRISGEHAEPRALLRDFIGAIEHISPINRDFQFGGAPNLLETAPPPARLSGKRPPLSVSTDEELAASLGIRYVQSLNDQMLLEQLGLRA